jgi:hypothetical protein
MKPGNGTSRYEYLSGLAPGTIAKPAFYLLLSCTTILLLVFMFSMSFGPSAIKEHIARHHAADTFVALHNTLRI